MKNREERTSRRSESTAFAPLNPAHLTHEPTRRAFPWTRVLGVVVATGVVVEVVRLALGA